MKVLCLLFLFTSCLGLEKDTENHALRNIFERLIYTEEVIEVNPELSQNVIINEPKNTWQFLFKAKIKLSPDSYLIDCLFYKVPADKENGILKLKTQGFGEDCKKDYLSKGKWEASKIKEFSFGVKEGELSFSIQNKIYKFTLINTKSLKASPKLFESGIKNDLVIMGEGTLKYNVSELYREKDLKEGDICHKLDNSCKEGLPFECDRCPHGIYTQIISSNCRKSYNKVCGDLPCGGVGEIACIRGFEATQFKFNYCINDAPVGFCQKGLRVYCKDQKLVCDY